jgi:MarR family transcriptional regulator, lower aerobic nicotinate degradation pathway regulator
MERHAEADGGQLPCGLLASPGFLLTLVGAESRKRWVEGLARWQLRPAHFGVLTKLGEMGSRSPKDLGAAIRVDSRSLVAVIDPLEGRRLVRRVPELADRRRKVVELTAEGHELLRRLRESGAEVERDMVATPSQHEQATLHQLLLKLMPSHTAADQGDS